MASNAPASWQNKFTSNNSSSNWNSFVDFNFDDLFPFDMVF